MIFLLFSSLFNFITLDLVSESTRSSLFRTKNGKIDGYHCRWYENGNKQTESNFVNGVTDGLQSVWYENGHIQGKGIYQIGKRHGVWSYYYDNGQKNSNGEFVNGNFHGDWITWHSNGEMKLKQIWNLGELINKNCFDENGNICECDTNEFFNGCKE